MGVGRGHETPGSEVKECFAHGNSSSQSVSVALVSSAPIPMGLREEGCVTPAHAVGRVIG